MPFTNEKLLVHLSIDPPAGWLDKVRERFPGLDVRWEKAHVLASTLSSADELPSEVLDGVTMMCVYPPPSEENTRNVRFVQLASAGSNHWVGHSAYENRDVDFCSSSGVHS